MSLLVLQYVFLSLSLFSASRSHPKRITIIYQCITLIYCFTPFWFSGPNHHLSLYHSYMNYVMVPIIIMECNGAI